MVPVSSAHWVTGNTTSASAAVSDMTTSQTTSRSSARIRSATRADAGADTDEARRTREEQAQKILAEGTGTIAEDFLKKVLTPETLSR